MDERDVTDAAIEAIGEWLDCPWVAQPEASLVDGSGRADAVIIGGHDVDEPIVVALESKSSKTIRQLRARYDAVGHIGESTFIGALVGLANPVVGAMAGLGHHALTDGPHDEADAIGQLWRYPGDYRVLAIPSDALYDDEDEVLLRGLRAGCNQAGFGLLVIEDFDDVEWIVAPTRLDDEDPLYDYRRGEELLDDLVDEIEG